jgi:DNA polymerase-1
LVKHVEAQYGVLPTSWCDRTALVGDVSDGIKGIRGIGKRTAARLLAGGLVLGDLPASDRLTRRTGYLIRDGFQAALTCRDLARMRTDIPLPVLPVDQPSPLLPASAAMVDMLQLW